MTSSGIQSPKDLVAWQRAVECGLLVYRLSKDFPDSERFGLTSQIRRAAVSVASNIAEEYGRGTTTDYLRFLRVARGSLYEVETQLVFAVRLGYLNQQQESDGIQSCRECGKVLAGLIRSVERSEDGQG